MNRAFPKSVCVITSSYVISLTLLMTSNASAFELERTDAQESANIFPYGQTQKDFTETCVNHIYCPTNGNQNSSRYDLNSLCCIPCDCSETCFVAGTCCLDTPTRFNQASPATITEDPREICVKTYVGNKSIKTGVVDIHMYMMIQSCPSVKMSHAEDDVIAKCLQPDEDILNEIVPVYSNRTEKNYRNIFCATCNNDISGTAPWLTRFMCNSLKNAMTSFPIGANLLQRLKDNTDCFLHFSPVHNSKQCLDENEFISDCPKISFNNPLLEPLCRQNDQNYPVLGALGIYKNAFCLECNEGLQGVAFDFKRVCGTGAIAYFELFTTILGPGAYFDKPELQSKTDNNNCLKGLTYDNALQSCFLKSCPISTITVGQECIKVMQTIGGVSFDYRLKVLYPLDTFSHRSDDSVLAEVQPLIQHDDGSMVCESKVLGVQTQGEHMAFKIQLTKTFENRFSNVREDFHTLERKVRSLNQRASEGQVQYTVELDTSPFEPINFTHVNVGVYMDYVRSFKCGDSIAVTNMQFCDTVMVNKYAFLKDGIVLANKVYFKPGEYISQFKEGNQKPPVYICYDLFVSRIKQYQSTTTNVACARDKCSVQSLCILLFYYLFFNYVFYSSSLSCKISK